MNIRTLPIDQLVLDPKNARTHDKRNLETIHNSLAQFGQVENIVVQAGTHKVIGGNGRVQAMRDAGATTVEANVVDVTDAQAAKMALALNRTAQLAGWSKANLADTVGELVGHGIDVADIGFNDAELADLIGLPDLSLEPDDDAVAEPSEGAAVSKVGDIWQLGEHRLMCGDSTCANHVNALMQGRDADICFTSPPYAQQRTYGIDAFDWDQLMQGVFGLLPMAPDGQVFVNLGMVYADGEWQPYWSEWIDWMRVQGWRRFGWYVWDQCSGIPGANQGRRMAQHEWIFHFNRSPKPVIKTQKCIHAGRSHSGFGMRNKDGSSKKRGGSGSVADSKVGGSVVAIERAKNDEKGIEHPAKFPVALPADFYRAHSGSRALCYEPFMGSGTSIIAAERTERICYGLELNPKYADVSVERWQNATGGKAVKVMHG